MIISRHSAKSHLIRRQKHFVRFDFCYTTEQQKKRFFPVAKKENQRATDSGRQLTRNSFFLNVVCKQTNKQKKVVKGESSEVKRKVFLKKKIEVVLLT